MKLQSIIAAAGIAGGGALSVATTPVVAAGPPGFTCAGSIAAPGFITAGTYSSLIMPAGTVCGVVGDVVVTRPVAIQDGAGLAVLAGSLTIHGAVTVATQGVLASFDNATPVRIGGPVLVGLNGAFIVGTETPFGPRVNSIGGPVTGKGESTVQVHNATIGGPVRLTGGGGDNRIVDATGGFGAFNDLEDNAISGPVSMTGYHGIWAGVIRNVIHGPFTFSNNVQAVPDEWDIGTDTIYGPATCNDNSPVPNTGASAGGPSVVFGPIRGDQASTCTSAL
ncbi:MAG TPA: hypothetical protein VN193_00065 [Candidatus Angelobacter sp.]|jgi:hypothetical protein|nr:hypothetical protein [Candidatus Angelobacter sp.]